MAESQSKRGPSFAYALRSFSGYLRGSGKAEHTVANYQSDLRVFERFVHEKLAKKRLLVSDLNLSDLRKYSEYLRSQGFHDNTRRRRLLTVRRLFQYLTKRGKLDLDLGRRLPAPHKVEKVPRVVDLVGLLNKISALPSDTALQSRNRTLLWLICETGCLVSEASALRLGQVLMGPGSIEFLGKGARQIPVSKGLLEALQELGKRNRDSGFLFQGFNRYGPIGNTSITPRGIELVFKKLLSEFGKITPRMVRHSVVVHWAQQGETQETIQARLGLKTDYAFRSYAPLLRAHQTGD
ncbi:MAG: site-specific integrase [Bdellovibrionales bacterium]|nr:site-specific integrase [Bdellovibrionales bacterium]